MRAFTRKPEREVTTGRVTALVHCAAQRHAIVNRCDPRSAGEISLASLIRFAAMLLAEAQCDDRVLHELHDH